MNSFSNLSLDEISKLAHAPLLVGLLIAEADGESDHKELEWIEKVTSFRMKTAHHSLRSYYELAHKAVQDNLALERSNLPTDQEAKMSHISNRIAEMKPILEKLDERTKHRVIDSLHSFALSIAEISGGFLNFFSKNPEEEKWLGLSMLEA